MAYDPYGPGFFTDVLVVALLKQAGARERQVTVQRPILGRLPTRPRPGPPGAVSACPGGAW
jgi:hypothetical protein